MKTYKPMTEFRVFALSGGVGGAKLVLGLHNIISADQLGIIANVGDDFRHLGLYICPDIDTILYTLAGKVNTDTGWGRADETWNILNELKALGGENWFLLGDKDLATHAIRTSLLDQGLSLSAATASLVRQHGLKANLFPASNDPIQTTIGTDNEDLAFQHYFVREQCKPIVRNISFSGSEKAAINNDILSWASHAPLDAVIIGPSNPYLSIDPILAIPGASDFLHDLRVPVVAVSPIIGGTAVKGPTTKIMKEMNLTESTLTIAQHYKGLVDGLVIDEADKDLAGEIEALGIRVLVTKTLMRTLDDKTRVAKETLLFAKSIDPADTVERP